MGKNNVWMSVSDLMTGLMVIFLFVAIAYIKRVQNNQTLLTEYVDNRKTLHDKLIAEFKEESKQGKISIDGDLSMRFENAQTQFAPGSWELTPAFKKELANYIPRYLNKLLDAKMNDKIKEIRIEGHTDNVPYQQLDPDPYYANLILSQRGALSVMQYIRNLPEYKQYSKARRDSLEYWFTANGMSYGRALDDNGEYIHKSLKSINKSKSRRVEIRLITVGEEMLEEFVGNNK